MLMRQHGTMLVMTVDSLPKEAQRCENLILAQDSETGQTHHVADANSAELYAFAGRLYLRVTARRATLMHPQDKPLHLSRGMYIIWQQHEYTPERVVRVVE